MLRILHPFPSVLVTAITVAIALLLGGADHRGTIASLAVGMLAYQFSIGVLNDIVDAEDDRAARISKPLSAGLIALPAARLLFAICLAIGLGVTLLLGPIAWLVGIAGASMGLVYDLRLKRTDWSWLPYSLAFPLVPIWAAVALDRWEAVLWATLPLGAVLGFAIHLANQASDLDSATGGFVERLGERRAERLAVALFFAVALAVTALRWPASALAGIAAIGVAMAALLLARLWRRRPAGLFAALSIGGGGLAITLLSALRQ